MPARPLADRTMRRLALALGIAVGAHLGLLGWLAPEPAQQRVRPPERRPALHVTRLATRAWPPPAAIAPRMAAAAPRLAEPRWLDRRRPAARSRAAARAAPAASAPASSAPAAPVDAPLALQLPPAERLQFSARRGDELGEAELRWERPGAGGYELLLVLRYAGQAREALIQSSRGGLGASGLQPRRYVARRGDAGLRAARFDVGDGQGDGEQALPAGTQDRLSWLAQLTAVAAAWQAPPPAGTRIVLPVAGMRGERDDWVFEVQAPAAQDAAVPAAEAGWLHLSRAPLHRYDHRIDLWLDARRPGWPLRISWTHPARAALVLERRLPQAREDDGTGDAADAMQQR